MGDETPSPSSSPKLGEDSPDKETVHEGADESPDHNNDHHRDETLPAPWEAYQDDEGRTYYFNADTGETTWDKPMSEVEVDGGGQDHEQQQGDEMELKEEEEEEEEGGGDVGEEMTPGQSIKEEENQENEAEWIAYQDDEGREYYYNTVTQVTQWDKPENFEPPSGNETTDDVREEADPSVDKSSRIGNDNGNDDDDKSMVEAGEVAEEEAEEEKVVELSEEEKKQIETKSTLDTLSSSDMMLEPGCFSSVVKLVTLLGAEEGRIKAVQSLTDGFQGQSGICAILSVWLQNIHLKVGMKSKSNSSENQSSNFVRDLVVSVIENLVKERFSQQADEILNLSQSEAVFLQKMMDSKKWRRMLIDLTATHKGSALLNYCLQYISSQGYHKEISSRVNQSDHFGVFNGMISSELTIVGNVNENRLREDFMDQISDIRRLSTSTSYTFLYATKVLEKLLEFCRDKKDWYPSHILYRRWGFLKEMLEEEMMTSSSSSKDSSMSSLITKKRRLDITLGISDLRKRCRIRLEANECSPQSSNINLVKQKIDEAVLNFMRKGAINMKLEMFDIPEILPGETASEINKYVGETLTLHPLAIDSLLGGLFKPGSGRVSSPDLKKRISELVGLAVVASILKSPFPKSSLSADEIQDNISKGLLSACHLCESIENMISFSVAENPTKDDSSSGHRLCYLCIKFPVVAQGVLLWAAGLATGDDFVSSASYATLTPCILGIARVIAKSHRSARTSVTDLATIFLKQKVASSREMSYQQSKSLKEQCIRLMIWLIVLGEAPSVFTTIKEIIKSNESILDSSLLRYFISGVLEVLGVGRVQTLEISQSTAITLSRLLCLKYCSRALNAAYFEHKANLHLLLRYLVKKRVESTEYLSLSLTLKKVYSNS